MAKMRVHEVAKELDVKSKDVVEFLAGEGVEVKAQSSIEDDNIEKVRKHFGGASKPAAKADKEEKPKKTTKKSTKKAEEKEEAKEEKAEESSEEEKEEEKKPRGIITSRGVLKTGEGSKDGKKKRKHRSSGEHKHHGEHKKRKKKSSSSDTIEE